MARAVDMSILLVSWRWGSLRIVGIAFTVLICLATAGLAAPAKTLVFCSRESPDTFNPQLSTSQATFDASARQVYDRLLMLDAESGEVVPALAETWQVSDDGLDYVFRLRAGVAFHTTPLFQPTRNLTAEDVVFSFARQLDRKHPWHAVSGGRYLYLRALGLDDLIESVAAVDELTVAFRLRRPSASFPSILAMDFASILSAEYAQVMADAGTPERLDRDPVGTGPFMLVQYQRDALIRYVAHRDYWRGPARLDNLVIAVVPDAAVRLQKLRNGECHVIDRPDPADLPALQADPSILVTQKTSNDIGFLAFNTDKPPLDDVRVRRALSLAIDRQAIVNRAYGGGAVAAAAPLPPNVWPAGRDVLPAPPNPIRARQILSEVGDNRIAVEIWAMPVSRPYMRSARRVAEMIRDDWAAIGVDATIEIPDWETFLKHSMLGLHEAILFGWVGETLDPDAFLSPLLSCAAVGNGANRSRWCDAGFDRLLYEARRSSDRAERATIYGLALDRLHDEVPLVPLAHSVAFTPMRRGVTGYKAAPLGGHYFYEVDLP